ncbi:MAG: GntR family transcriptional regulator [Actinomycetota bacterium]
MSQRNLLRRRTTAETVAEMLRSEIQRGQLSPGTRLRQNEVAQRFGVSTTPVREALALLQAEGLVRIDPHRGALVFHPTVTDLRESYEIRGALESLAITKAIPQLTDGLIADLQKLIDRMRKERREMKWVEMNNEFHLRLYEASQLPRLCSIIASLRDSSSTYIHMFAAHDLPEHQADDDHQEILDACAGRDVRRARKAIATHITNTVDGLVKFLEERPEMMGT